MAETAPKTALTEVIIFTGEAFVERQALLVQEGKILDLVQQNRIPDGFIHHPCGGGILAPGFIDAQVNGGDNILFNDQPTAQALRCMASVHRKTGTTRFLPTCISDKPEVARKALEAVRTCRRDLPDVLGIHFEGPYINPAMRGIHQTKHLRALTDADIDLYKPQEGEVILLTLAPEIVPPAQIEQLVAQGTIVTLGHSAATPEQTRAALAAGARGFTHLFTRMEPIAGRSPGMAATALDDAESWCGIIGDTHHVTPEMMRLSCRAKAEGKLFMVSDCMPPAGAADPQPFTYDGVRVYPTPGGGLCRDGEGRVAGSMMTLGECVAASIRHSRLDPAMALRMASASAADFLGLGDRLGRLLPGYDAEIVLLDHGFKAKDVFHG